MPIAGRMPTGAGIEPPGGMPIGGGIVFPGGGRIAGCGGPLDGAIGIRAPVGGGARGGTPDGGAPGSGIPGMPMLRGGCGMGCGGC